jgi:hypothetical protein
VSGEQEFSARKGANVIAYGVDSRREERNGEHCRENRVVPLANGSFRGGCVPADRISTEHHRAGAAER